MPRRIIKGGVRAVKWWWGLPDWFKFGKVIAIILVIIGLPLVDSARQWMQYHQIYSTYYDHFYGEYVKTQPHDRADYYADYYADFYAQYYSSPGFREAQHNALPSASASTLSYPRNSPVAHHRTNHAGLNLIKGFEGLETEPYADVGGKLTIGYGHLIKPGEFYGRISEKQAYELLQQDVQVAEAYIKRYVKVPLRENQFAALVSLVYNIGPGHFRKSTLLKHLNNRDYARAGREFLRWNKVGTKEVAGLTRRRESEKALFES